MKKVILAVCLAACVFAGRAQVMQQKAAWATFSVPQMKCWECKEKLQKYLMRDEEGAVLQIIINMFTGSVRVQYVPDRYSVPEIRQNIANAGFDADSVKADENAYKLLPPSCKRKEDGGGPQKGKPCNVPPADNRR